MLTFLIALFYFGVSMPLIIKVVKVGYFALNEDEIPPVKWRKSLILSVSGSLLLTVLLIISHYYNETLWFKELGFSSVFWTEFNAKIIIFVISFVSVFLILSLIHFVTFKMAPAIPYQEEPKKGKPHDYSDRRNYDDYIEMKKTATSLKWTMFFSIIALSLMIAFLVACYWQDFLLYFSQVPSGKTDPIFNKDISFYFFSLPLYIILMNIASAVLLIGLTTASILHSVFYTRTNRFWDWGDEDAQKEEIKRTHLKAIYNFYFGTIIAVIIIICLYLRLGIFYTLFSSNNLLYGASYSTVNATIPGLETLIVVLLLSIIPYYFFIKRQNWKIGIYTTFGLISVSFVLCLLWPTINQNFVVKPSQLDKEDTYIKNHIAFTREAYGLTKVTEKQFPAVEDLSFSDIQRDEETISNIRLWDWRALEQALRQKQEIRQYYKFVDIDVDRYTINGKRRQVMMSAREISTENLPSNSKNWVNTNLKYTHGYGVCMTFVNEFSEDKLPSFVLKNIPSVSSASEIKITRPEIYYGESTSNDVFVNSSTQEFDYPQGDNNVYCDYKGTGGIAIGSGLRRLSLALKTGGLTMLLSEYLKPESRLMLTRNVKERLSKIAPFLYCDPDFYVVIGENGCLYYLADCFTTSENYPYSTPDGNNFNYIRNSVKVVIDAYNGTTSLYITDSNDPIIKTWTNIFPKLFKPLSEMPADLQRHLRYPETLLKIQGKIYETYHMTDVNVFFNKEDIWTSALKKEGDGLGVMEPYFGMVKLPGEKKAEFIQMLPFTPGSKQNLIGWMASRSDKEHYGELLVYKFPKDKQVTGTTQIEAKIDQDQEMSKDLSLWKQKGSEVIRGNMLVIPIKNSLLYVEPIYIQATDIAMPQLTKVAVAYGEKIVWADSFDAALKQIFNVADNESVSLPSATEVTILDKKTNQTTTNNGLINQARDYYKKCLDFMGKGKIQEAGKAFEELGKTLNQTK